MRSTKLISKCLSGQGIRNRQLMEKLISHYIIKLKNLFQKRISKILAIFLGLFIAGMPLTWSLPITIVLYILLIIEIFTIKNKYIKGS